MKPKYLTLAMLILLSLWNLSAQISSGKKSFNLNNAPDLTIENVKFSDENQDQKADAGEKCFLTFNVKNAGKTKAKSVTIHTDGADSVHSYFQFDDAFLVGDIQVDESKEIKFPMLAARVFKTSKVSFNLMARDAGNFGSKPVFVTLTLKSSMLSDAFNWTYPDNTETKSKNNAVTIKACIQSAKQIQDLAIYNNNNLLSADRGFKLKKSGNCSQFLEQEIKLEEGNNVIQIKARINNDWVESETRNIVYKKVEYEKRYALVIGNADYPNAVLRNPVNDANLVTAELKRAGFVIRTVKNGSQNQMKQAISEFGDLLDKDKNAVGLFYYAGHGIQIKGKNYLVPTDAQISKEPDVEVYCVDLDGLLANLEYAGNRLNIIILDACRNNPYSRGFRSMAGNGLATVNAPVGTFIAYATSPGSVAADGSGNNGLYTQEFVKALATPDIKIEDVFKTVRTNVKNISGGQQIPWENSSIEGDFYFIR
jgi:hypothetical protein